MVRVKEGTLIGHAPITTQLDWCARAHLHRAIFTHCGSPIVRGDPRALDAIIRSLGRQYGIDARLASDGDRLSFPGSDERIGSGVIELRKRTERAKQRGCRDAYPA
jgi:hypothetical protein